MKRSEKRGQVSIEYLILVGFVTFVIIGTLGIAFFYSGGIRDRIKSIQINNFADRVISTAESVYYYGNPSKATIALYLPEGIRDVEFNGENLFISIQTSSGLEKLVFSSKVPLEGNISTSFGIKNIEISAQEDNVIIKQI
jgi:uncharacterized protein (UPF0333 family)